jgi:hypothetical protein
MKQDFTTIHIRIDTKVYKALGELVAPNVPSISFLIRCILRDYIRSTAHVDVVAEIKPLTNLENPGGLVIPEKVPEITSSGIVNVGSISRPRGIDDHVITLAKRNKRRGLPYDESLEPFFTNE